MFTKGYFCAGRGSSVRRLAAVAAMLAAALTLAACGGSGGDDVSQAKIEGEEHANQEHRLEDVEEELEHLHRRGHGRTGPHAPRRVEAPPTPPTTSPSTSSLESCGGELEVNSDTSCPFAEAVENAYFSEIGSGSGDVDAYSPVTNKTYVMYCTSSPHQCTGGNNAAVYFP